MKKINEIVLNALTDKELKAKIFELVLICHSREELERHTIDVIEAYCMNKQIGPLNHDIIRRKVISNLRGSQLLNKTINS